MNDFLDRHSRESLEPFRPLTSQHQWAAGGHFYTGSEDGLRQMRKRLSAVAHLHINPWRNTQAVLRWRCVGRSVLPRCGKFPENRDIIEQPKLLLFPSFPINSRDFHIFRYWIYIRAGNFGISSGKINPSCGSTAVGFGSVRLGFA